MRPLAGSFGPKPVGPTVPMPIAGTPVAATAPVPVAPESKYKLGDIVEGKFMGDDQWYKARIIKVIVSGHCKKKGISMIIGVCVRARACVYVHRIMGANSKSPTPSMTTPNSCRLSAFVILATAGVKPCPVFVP